jgi:acyl-CoA synthetase (AMP-forming)/AMP-acid ligase II
MISADPRDGLPPAVRTARAAMEEEWRAGGWYRSQVLADVLAEGAARHPDCRIIFDSDTRPASVTLPALQREALAVAGSLAALGLRAGDVLAVQLPNWPETAALYYAAAALGLVLLPIVPIYGPAEVDFILRDAGARAFVLPSRHRRADAADVLGRLGEQPTLDHVVVIGDTVPDGALGWGALRARTARVPDPPRDPSALALVVYTSGTTAEPKGVLHSHDSLVAELVASPTPPTGVPGTVTLQPFPAGHTAGLVALMAPPVHGCTTVVMDAWDADRAARLVAEHGVTSMAGTPILVTTLLESAERQGLDISSLVHGVTGGAGVPPSLIERADAIGFRISRCYGATEAPSLTASAADAPLGKRAHTDGRPLGGARLRILDDEGRDVGPGEEGEVAIAAPEAFIAYTDPALNRTAFTEDGWFLSGDVGRLDDEGYLTITDRKKDIIIRGGENLSSKEIEDVLLRHPAIAEAAVVAMPDERYGERVCAFVVAAEGQAPTLDDVRRHFEAEGVARQKTPERLEVEADLPRTPAGKVRKAELRERLAGRSAA